MKFAAQSFSLPTKKYRQIERQEKMNKKRKKQQNIWKRNEQVRRRAT